MLIENSIDRSCLNCGLFDAGKEICRNWGVRPPAEIIVFSCIEEWEKDIPF
jgi:hypothetical protein